MRFARLCSAVVVLMLLGGCAASGPIFKEVSASFPPVPGDKGRIFFYRPDTIFGAAVTSTIRLNGRAVGVSERGSVFYVDEKPGSCLVSTSTEVEKQLSFTLEQGETKFVRTSVSWGVAVGRINAELINTDQAKTEIADLHYTGGQLPKK